MTDWQAEEIRHAIRKTFGPYEYRELVNAFDRMLIKAKRADDSNAEDDERKVKP